MTGSNPADPESPGKRLDVNGDHHCFGCGKLNPHGLKLEFLSGDDGSVWCDWTPTREQEGFNGIAHGGMITTVLDEVMGWVLSANNIWAVTGRLNVSFRNPVAIGRTTRARAWIVAEHARKLDLGADLRESESGQLLAEATGVFVRVPRETAEDWQSRYLGGV